MTDPLERATSRPPPTLGEGCVRRYDPEVMDDSIGSDFPGAAELWQQLQDEQAQAQEAKPPRK